MTQRERPEVHELTDEEIDWLLQSPLYPTFHRIVERTLVYLNINRPEPLHQHPLVTGIAEATRQ